jgi:hypothetical protein
LSTSRINKIRSARVAGTAGACLLLAGVLATPAAAAGNGPGGPVNGHVRSFNFVQDASYVLDMRDAGVEENTNIPSATYQDLGFSGIQLTHDIGQPQGKCDARGAGYYFGQYVEDAVLSKGAAPPDAGDVSGGYANPVNSRTVYPNPHAGADLTSRHPFIQNPFPPGQEITPLPNQGTPLYITSSCDNDLKGSATGNVGDAAKTADLIGSTTDALVEKTTGQYISTARAYITGIKGAGTLSSISSLMQVKALPGAEPVVSYRLSLFDNSTGDSDSGFNQKGITFSGTNVPANQLTDQFNSQTKSLGAAAAAFGPFGVQIMAPETGAAGPSDTGTSGQYITAPAVQLDYGLKAREGGIGEHQRTRFASITYTGNYGNA